MKTLPDAAAETPKRVYGSATALVLEDSHAQFQIIAGMIERQDWSVVHCGDLREAAELVNHFRFQALLLAVFVGAHNSIRHVSRFRKLAPDTPIIIMTAGSTREAIEETLKSAREAKADFVLRKPFTELQLANILQKTYKDEVKGVRRKHILVIDDGKSIRSLATGILEFGGYRVSTAGSMEDALRDIDIAHVDLVLCDIFMPGMGGYRGIRVIKSTWPQVQIIAMSAGNAERVSGGEALSVALKVGADAQISKPFTTEALIDLVNRVLLGPQFID